MKLLLKYEILKRKYIELQEKYEALLNLIDEDFWNELDLSTRISKW